MGLLSMIFWVAASLVFYTYAGYLILLHLLPRTPATEQEGVEPVDPPTVTMVIAAYNEAKYIRAKLENALSVEYPADRYRVVVVSDGSEDATDRIVDGFTDDRLTFLRVDERAGKANALNHALRIVDSEYVVFTDANVFVEPDSVSMLVETAIANNAGVVTGRIELESLEDKEPLGEGVYMRYERYLQALESKFWSVAGVDGALFAARRDLVEYIPTDTILDDFLIGIRIALRGHRISYQPAAQGSEQVPAEVSQEFRRKTRIAAGGFQLLSRLSWREFLGSPWRFQVAFVSHKVIRWYVPWLLLLILGSNLFLLAGPVYQLALVVQMSVYLLAAFAALMPEARNWSLPYIAYYFVAMNFALFAGWFRHKRARQSVMWNRVNR